jgi:8-amino-3,8-dideoxy-alpha-D-manno-octulosonate transaminase
VFIRSNIHPAVKNMQISWPYEFPGVYWLDDQEKNAVHDVLSHGSLFRYYGLNPPKYVDEFEASARQYFGKRFALGVNSGTGALNAAMSALSIGPGSEVIIPAFMWVATVSAVVQQNAIPVLCEVDETLCMDPADLERKISPRTKLIVPIHMIGTPCKIDAILSIAERHDIPVLEDTAQAMGCSYFGRRLGSMGSIGIFSLQLNKNITCGEGGLLITDDERLYNRAFSAHDMGMIRVNGRLATPAPDAVAWGAGRRMSELCGAVASVQIKKLDRILEAMRASRRRIRSMIEGTPGVIFPSSSDPDGESGAFLLMQTESEKTAVALAAHMKANGLHNVFHVTEYGLHIYHRIPALAGKVPMSPAGNPWSLKENCASVFNYQKGACPQSDDFFARSVLLPIPSCLNREQETAAAGIIRQAMSGVNAPPAHSRLVKADAEVTVR